MDLPQRGNIVTLHDIFYIESPQVICPSKNNKYVFLSFLDYINMMLLLPQTEKESFSSSKK